MLSETQGKQKTTSHQLENGTKSIEIYIYNIYIETKNLKELTNDLKDTK